MRYYITGCNDKYRTAKSLLRRNAGKTSCQERLQCHILCRVSRMFPRLLNETAWIVQAHSNTGNAGEEELPGAHSPCATQNASD